MNLEFGNKDTDKQYDLSGLKISDDRVVVRHFEYLKLANGGQMEDPSTSRIQVYSKDVFDKLNRQPEVKGKQLQSQFQENGLNVHVLHYPGEDAPGNGKGAPGNGLKPVKEVTELIEAAISIEEVDALIDGDTRKGVLAAADKKKESLNKQ